MSTVVRGAPSATLTSLPQDVLLHILDRLTPSQIAAYTQLCTFTAASAADPSIWASLARRHLGIAPPAAENTLNAKELSRLATSLVSKWWLVTGAFVSGIPVHFRKGFVDIRARGGVERLLDNDTGTSAYVFGGIHKEAALPVALPSVAMDFFLDAAGPFPMDGMVLRLVHATEIAEKQTSIPSSAPDPSPLTALNLGASHFSLADTPVPSQDHVAPTTHPSSDEARVRIKLNNTTIADVITPPAHKFSAIDIPLAPDLLATKPRINTLVVEYDRSSTAAYWLKQVSVVPAILPMPNLTKEDLPYLCTAPSPPPLITPIVPEYLPLPNAEPSTPPPPPPPFHHTRSERAGDAHEHTTPPPRRNVGHSHSHMHKHRPVEPTNTGRHHKHAKFVKQARKPKHVFHNNHYRSPRGHAPSSPRSRSGR